LSRYIFARGEKITRSSLRKSAEVAERKLRTGLVDGRRRLDLAGIFRPGEAPGTQTARSVPGAPECGAEEKTGHCGRDDSFGDGEKPKMAA